MRLARKPIQNAKGIVGTCVGVYIQQNYLNQSMVFLRRGYLPSLRGMLTSLNGLSICGQG